MKEIISCLIILFIVVSCTSKKNYSVENINGIKTIKNKNIVIDNNSNIQAKLIFSIKGNIENCIDSSRIFFTIAGIDIDKNDNIFLLDVKTSNIKKFDKTGQFIKSFGRKGQGPGETIDPNSITILNDTVFISNPGAQQVVKYDLDGNFIESINLKSAAPQFANKVGTSKFIGFLEDMEDKNGDLFLNYNLTILNSKFEPLSIINKKQFKIEKNMELNYLDLLIPYTISDSNIFVSANLDDKYKIDVYDLNYKQLYSVEKQFVRLPFNKDEMKEFDNMMFRLNGSNGNQPKFSTQYKKPINNLYFDKYGRLLIAVSQKRDNYNKNDLVFDIFKDGIFLNTIKFNICNGYDFMDIDNRLYFIKNKIYLVKTSENIINVYDY